METQGIKERIINNQELFEITIGDNSRLYKMLMGEPTRETLFFVERHGKDFIFCRAKLPNEITEEDFFGFTEEMLDKYLADGKIKIF